MSASEHHAILQEIVSHFEALAIRIEHAIEVFAQDESGSVDLALCIARRMQPDAGRTSPAMRRRM